MKSFSLDFILLIPCYNNLEGLIKSIKSVNYSPSRFEILVVDDGSFEPIVKEHFATLPQFDNIRILRIEPNKGILNALNTGLGQLISRDDFKYIARLDAGDICSPDRFEKQVGYLDLHPDIGLLGTWCRFSDKSAEKSYIYKTKIRHEEIVREMYLKCSFIHPTVMFRREILNEIGLYPEGFLHAEDYAYFWKILKKFKGAILPEILVDIEYRSSNISAKNYKAQLRSRMKVVNFFGENNFKIILNSFLLECKSVFPKAILERLK